MKKLFIPVFALLLLASCEDIEDNDNAFQANVENVFFKANSTLGYKTEENFTTYRVFEGESQSRKLTLKIKWHPENETFTLGGETKNVATFEDGFGNLYTTGPEAKGEAVIFNQRGDNYSGSFHFMAISAANDTITVNNGIFYEVSTAVFIDTQD